MSQTQIIFNHLKRRSITPLIAWQYYGIYRLSDVIFKLRNQLEKTDMKIRTEINKEKLYTVRETQALVGKVSAEDKVALESAFDKLINGIKAKHL